MKHILKRLGATLILLTTTASLQAQTNKATETKVADSITQADYALHPRWIAMMDDTAANYFEVCRAFYTFWEGKIKPVRDDNEARDIFSGREKKEQEEETQPSEYTYEYKRFKFWERYYKDLHDENGIIFSPDRIIAEWKKQQEAIIQEGGGQ